MRVHPSGGLKEYHRGNLARGCSKRRGRFLKIFRGVEESAGRDLVLTCQLENCEISARRPRFFLVTTVNRSETVVTEILAVQTSSASNRSHVQREDVMPEDVPVSVVTHLAISQLNRFEKVSALKRLRE